MLKKLLTVLTMMLFSFVFSQQIGMATYYNDKYVGKKTANNSIFSQNALTCASNVHKLGSKLRVTNMENGKSVIVIVTDTGRFKMPRIVDLTKKAFTEIATLKRGIVRVLVEEVD